MAASSTALEFSDRDLTFLLDQANRSHRLGLSIDPSSIVKEDGAVRFKAAYWGEHGLSTFVAPLDETVPGQVRIKSILSPTAITEDRSWSADGMSTGGYKVILWSLRQETDMTLTAEGRDNIPADFEVQPWGTPMATEPRSLAWEMRARIRQWGESRETLADALASSLEDDTIVDRAQAPVGPSMR